MKTPGRMMMVVVVVVVVVGFVVVVSFGAIVATGVVVVVTIVVVVVVGSGMAAGKVVVGALPSPRSINSRGTSRCRASPVSTNTWAAAIATSRCHPGCSEEAVSSNARPLSMAPSSRAPTRMSTTDQGNQCGLITRRPCPDPVWPWSAVGLVVAISEPCVDECGDAFGSQSIDHQQEAAQGHRLKDGADAPESDVHLG